MGEATITQTSFSAGELSPRMSARTDQEIYQRGAELLQNFVVQPQGGAVRRAGTVHAAEVKDSTVKPRLISFIFAAGDSYVLEFGNLSVRFYQTNGQVKESLSVTGASYSVDTATIVVASHNATPGDVVVVAGMNPSGYDGTFVVSAVSGGTDISYLLAVDPGAFVAGGTVQSPFEIVSPFATADLAALTFAQEGDAILFAHVDFAPRSLLRTSALVWAFSVIDFIDGPYLLDNATATTLTPNGTTGSINITASSIVGINGGIGFQSTDVGRSIRIQNGGSVLWGYADITSITSTTVVVALVVKAFDGVDAVTTWRLGAWSDTTKFPRAVAFHQSRSVFGGTNTEPERIWWSNTSIPFDFTPTDPDGTLKATHSVTLDCDSQELAQVFWLKTSQKILFAGTLSGVFSFSGADGVLTPTNFDTSQATNIRAAETGTPVVINGTICYIQRQRRKIRALIFNNDIKAFNADDLNLFADHMSIGDINEIAYADQPNAVLWCVLNDGDLVALTYQAQNGIVAWHRHVVGGTGVNVESVASIPVGTHDQVWFVVQRTINGGSVRYIEFMEREFETPTIREDVYYLDSSIEFKGSAATVITLLEHLEGETVSVLADGSTVEDETVLNGQITLENAATNVKVGLPYNSDLVPMRAEIVGGRATSILHHQKKVHHATVLLADTVGLRIGDDAANLHEIIFREPSDPTNAPVPLFTGNKREAIDGRYDPAGQIFIRQSDPLPATILGLVIELETENLTG